MVIQDLVYTKLPYLANSTDNNNVIDSFTKELFYELQGTLDKSDTEVEDETAYSELEKSMISDVVCFKLIHVRGLSNMEGTDGSSAENRLLKRAEAGSVATEFTVKKANDGVDLRSTMEKFKQFFVDEANRKAMQLGFIWDISNAGQLVVEAFQDKATNIYIGKLE